MKEMQRISKDDVMSLLAKNTAEGVLSIYLGLPTTDRHDPGRWLSAIHSGLRELLHAHPNDRQLPRLIQTAESEIDRLPVETRRRSLVYLRSLDPDWVFWRSLHLHLPDLFVFADTPQVARLVELLDEAPVVGVALLSQDRTRTFTWKEGLLEEAETIPAEEESVAPSTGQPKPLPPNRMEDRARRGLTRMAQRLARVGDAQRWQKLLLIGSSTSLAAVGETLPDAWKRQVIERVELNMINAPLSEISALVSRSIHSWRRRDEVAEVIHVIEEARSGGRACSGVEASLEHLHKGRVERLFVCSDLELQGFVEDTGRLHLRAPALAEGDSLRPEPHLVERMVAQALEAGAAVVPLEGESAKKLGLLGGVAARLRWKDAGGGK